MSESNISFLYFLINYAIRKENGTEKHCLQIQPSYRVSLALTFIFNNEYVSFDSIVHRISLYDYSACQRLLSNLGRQTWCQWERNQTTISSIGYVRIHSIDNGSSWISFLLALKYHPDKNTDPKAEETFRSIAEAYDVLGDPNKRRQYDLQGHQSFTSSSNTNGFSGFQFDMHDFFRNFDSNFHHAGFNDFGFGAFDDDDAGDIFGHGDPFDFGDLFQGLGGNLFGGSHSIHVQTSGSSQQNCRTVTKRQGNTVSTIRECFWKNCILSIYFLKIYLYRNMSAFVLLSFERRLNPFANSKNLFFYVLEYDTIDRCE